MKSLFVTATDTDIGKTYVCAGIAHSLKKSGIDVGWFSSNNEIDEKL